MIQVTEFIRLRKIAGLTQKKLAKAAGVSQQLILEIEKERTRTSNAIYRLAAALGTEAHKLDPDIPAPKEVTLPELRHILVELQEMEPNQRTIIVQGINAWLATLKRNSVDNPTLPFRPRAGGQK